MSTVPGDGVPGTYPGAARLPRTVRSQPVDLVGALLHRLPHAGDALACPRAESSAPQPLDRAMRTLSRRADSGASVRGLG